ncbi:MAG: FtsQ-type POTRA domain-containing protein [Chloroflexi bacterium]|nr:FtsQ-type POTRA domain-containing protein [Chloroflexota bacterium]
MPGARTPNRWPYNAAKPARGRRVVKAKEPVLGVERAVSPEPRFRLTRKQARITLALAAMAMLLSAAWWAYRAPFATVQRVSIAGAAQVPPEQVRAAAAVDGKSLIGLDLAAAQARVAGLPKVSSATVTRDGWNGVAISITERTAWGSWRMGTTDVPIDKDGYVLDGPAAPAGSPVIQEVDAARVLNAGESIDPGAVELAVRLEREADSAFGRRVLAFAYRQSAGLTVVLSGSDVDEQPLWVTFGDIRDYEYKIAALYVLIEQARQQDITLTSVDLRFGDRLSFTQAGRQP